MSRDPDEDVMEQARETLRYLRMNDADDSHAKCDACDVAVIANGMFRVLRVNGAKLDALADAWDREAKKAAAESHGKPPGVGPVYNCQAMTLAECARILRRTLGGRG